MDIEIHSISGGDIEVYTCEDDVTVEQVTRTQEGKYTTITITLIDELYVEEVYEEEENSEELYELGYSDGLRDGGAHGKDQQAVDTGCTSESPSTSGTGPYYSDRTRTQGSIFNR